MPTYDIHHRVTGETREIVTSYSNLQQHLIDNPDWVQSVCAPNFVSGIPGITHKVDSGFNDVLNRIAKANPYTPIADTHGDKGIKASATRNAVKRAKTRGI